MIIDTNRRTTNALPCLISGGLSSIIRYYARTTMQPEKRLTRAEAEAIVAAGLSLSMVHQAGGADLGSFSAGKGRLDAHYTFRHAIEVIGQPSDTMIYFAVDFDCSPVQVVSNIIPHFEAINAVNTSGAFSKRFRIGAYGNGAVLSRLLEDGLIEAAWLSQSTGHHGSAAFKSSGKWTLFQKLPSTLCNLGVDVDLLNPAAGGFGEFRALDTPQAVETVFAAALDMPGPSHRVAANAGLNLRAGPGVEFPVLRLLPAGTPVQVIHRVGDWAIVDVDGSSLADGAVHAAFLAAAS